MTSVAGSDDADGLVVRAASVDGFARVLRSALVAGWSTTGAVIAHVAGDGTPPPLMALIPVAVPTAGLVWWLSARRINAPVIVALLAAPQIAVHLLSGYLHGHQVAPTPLMAATHLVGLTVVAAALAHLERLWWSWWQAVSTVLVPTRAVITPGPAAIPIWSRVVGPRPDVLLGGLSRRGPPIS